MPELQTITRVALTVSDRSRRVPWSERSYDRSGVSFRDLDHSALELFEPPG